MDLSEARIEIYGHSVFPYGLDAPAGELGDQLTDALGFAMLRVNRLTRSALADERDAKTALQELLQARGEPTPRYQILKESGPAHRRNFQVGLVLDGKITAQGRGRTRKAAEQAAARKILQALREIT